MKHQEKVFELLAQIPRGKVTTYRSLAKLAGVASPRLIGSIIHKNPDPTKYPCHRVVRSDGSIADGYAFGGKEKQIELLKAEGIEFDKISHKIPTLYIQ